MLLRPIIPVVLLYKQKLVRYAALIDSGADYNVFHGDVAMYLGIKLKTGSKKHIAGISGNIRGYEHKIHMRIGDYMYKTSVIFSDQIPDNALAVLGSKGFFDQFVVTLDYSQKLIEIKR